MNIIVIVQPMKEKKKQVAAAESSTQPTRSSGAKSVLIYMDGNRFLVLLPLWTPLSFCYPSLLEMTGGDAQNQVAGTTLQ